MAREMKDSGIEWIGEIPKDWELVPLKYVASYNDETLGESTNLECEFDYIEIGSVEYGKGITEVEHLKFKDAPSRARRIVRKDDIIVSTVRTYLKAIADIKESDNMQIASTGFMVIRAKGINPVYLKHSMLSESFIGMVEAYSTGISYPAINASIVAGFKIPVPDSHEQKEIAIFLEDKCGKIDNILEKTHASIEEYKKLKQAVITQTVTKGIRSDREMKDSGNAWFGQIPADIKISRVGLHYEIILGKMLCTNQIDTTYTYEPYFCAADIHFEGIAASERKRMWFSPIEKQQYLVRKDDLLVVEGGAGAGGCAVAPIQKASTYIQNSIMIVRPENSANVRYLKYLIECLVKQGYIDVVCNKATIPHFTKDKLANVPFLVFPLQEQIEIAQYLDEKCSAIDELIAQKEQYLAEIENYKKSLIYEYVTGKKEVPQEYV